MECVKHRVTVGYREERERGSAEASECMKVLPEHRAAHKRVADVDRQDAELQGRHLGEGGRKSARNHRELCSILEVSED